ncbi:MAG: SulP family inorganic anion transporter [Bacteroidetes bacterium]|nr:SulP family inorganic anion transporter [Bacteroidota bacterium]
MNLKFNNIKGDLFGGITAGIVALPLALAFGVQSGMGAVAGLYGAIVLGILAAIFGGTATQISGPTGPMTVVSAAVIGTVILLSGSLENGMGVIIATFLLAGGFQILLGILKVGKYVKFIPYPVLSGFMSGIGAIIILYQLYPFFGHDSEKSTIDIIINFYKPLTAMDISAVGLGGLTIAIIYLFPKITKVVPSQLVALVVVTLTALFLKIDVPVIGNIPTGLPELKIASILSIEPSNYWLVVKFAITLAALGAIDSLLTSVIADNVTKTKHNSNRELIGQGIGNMASAIIGGIPGAGATMRTVVNINAGGKTRLSGLVHGLLLVVVLFGAGKYAAHIPMCVLAGILITVGIGIIDYKGLKHLLHVPRAEAMILVIVLAITVFGDLLTAVAVGMVLASLVFMKKMSDIVSDESKISSITKFEKELPWKDEKEVSDKIADKIYIKHIEGPLFFGFTAQFQQMTQALPEVKIVIMRMEKVPYIDQSGLYALEDVILELEKKDIVVLMTGIKEQPVDMLRKLNVVPGLIPESYLFTSFRGCTRWLKDNFEGSKDGFKRIVDDLHEIKKAKVTYHM